MAEDEVFSESISTEEDEDSLGSTTCVDINHAEFINASTTTDLVARPRNESLAMVEVAVLGFVFVFALLGNVVVLVRITHLARRKRMSRMNELIVHLSCADLFLAFFNVLPQLIWDVTDRFHGGNVLCKFIKYVQAVAMYSSSYVLLITVIDRYIAICRPFLASLWTSDRTQVLVVGAWALSFLFSVPQIFIFSYHLKEGMISCFDRFTPGWTFQAYVTCNAFAIYVIPSVVITCLYSRVLLAVRRSVRSGKTTLRRFSRFSIRRYRRSQRQHQESGAGGLRSLSTSTDTSTKLDVSDPEERRKKATHKDGGAGAGARKYQQLSRATVKTTRFTLTVIFSYLICWGPFYLSILWRCWDSDAPSEAPVMVIANLLSGLNSCTNPWLYMAFNCQRLPPPFSWCQSKPVRRQPVNRRTTAIEDLVR